MILIPGKLWIGLEPLYITYNKCLYVYLCTYCKVPNKQLPCLIIYQFLQSPPSFTHVPAYSDIAGKVFETCAKQIFLTYPYWLFDFITIGWLGLVDWYNNFITIG